MSQPIGRPVSGARYIVERAEVSEERVVYRGLVRLPDADLPLEVTVALPGGATRAAVQAGDAVEHEKTAAALIRAATKSAVAAKEELPRKIERWRG
jgi:hypothetical protein